MHRLFYHKGCITARTSLFIILLIALYTSIYWSSQQIHAVVFTELGQVSFAVKCQR